jgi:ATP-dependent exoDNAse (exonuclease V) alpha subunit
LYYYNILNKLHRNAYYASAHDKGSLYKKYFEFKDRHLSMLTFPLKDASGFERGWVNKEIYYGYGLTTHKLQGSTIDNIILDALDICYIQGDKSRPRLNYTKAGKNHDATSLKNRLLYTGLTRVRNMAHIII